MTAIFIEAVGGLTSGYLIDAIHSAGYRCIGSDISAASAGAVRVDAFVELPTYDDPALWDAVTSALTQHRVSLVIPTFDEMLSGWSARREDFKAMGVEVLISPQETVNQCVDKWQTAQLFARAGLPAPATSLQPTYALFKPREGRGSTGIYQATDEQRASGALPQGYISQQVVSGVEYTIDCLFDAQGEPIYIVPRRRLQVKDGKSLGGVVEAQPAIVKYIKQLATTVQFCGPINVQCFVDGDDIWFIEINPRLGGGSGLGMAATENWIPLFVKHWCEGKGLSADAPVQYGMRMFRQYREVYQ
ncbi:ATP-grasp domain-containing protein [Aestuariibacter halophilus]|uniref:ATP-grasp domain-containing protein n=1 Tax=Fluctibacter halophilus TaxID=226011 RepID=A0ABS8G3Q0_9ALTE|nr:ATP-grasp domain-containing protein [Aestuariibacter halophilus]MCC2615124.1 ATP-grasp domain-containing protein [Aestuariibacter halophilus]